MNKIPNDYIKLIITRFPPKWLDINKYPKTYIAKQLAPSQKILLKYKEDNNWNEYVSQFTYEMNNRKDMMNILGRLNKALHNGMNICLICYEKDYKHCHRYLIAKELEKHGIEWEEL